MGIHPYIEKNALPIDAGPYTAFALAQLHPEKNPY